MPRDSSIGEWRRVQTFRVVQGRVPVLAFDSVVVVVVVAVADLDAVVIGFDFYLVGVAAVWIDRDIDHDVVVDCYCYCVDWDGREEEAEVDYQWYSNVVMMIENDHTFAVAVGTHHRPSLVAWNLAEEEALERTSVMMMAVVEYFVEPNDGCHRRRRCRCHFPLNDGDDVG